MKRLVYLVLPGLLLASPARGDQNVPRPAATAEARALVVIRKGITLRGEAVSSSEIAVKPRERRCDTPAAAQPLRTEPDCRLIVYDLP